LGSIPSIGTKKTEAVVDFDPSGVVMLDTDKTLSGEVGVIAVEQLLKRPKKVAPERSTVCLYFFVNRAALQDPVLLLIGRPRPCVIAARTVLAGAEIEGNLAAGGMDACVIGDARDPGIVASTFRQGGSPDDAHGGSGCGLDLLARRQPRRCT
jgi:hypothetical protein